MFPRRLFLLSLLAGVTIAVGQDVRFTGTVPAPSYGLGTPGTTGQVVFKHTGTQRPEVEAFLDDESMGTFTDGGSLTINLVTVNAAHTYHFVVVATGQRVPASGEKSFTFQNTSYRKVVLGLKLEP